MMRKFWQSQQTTKILGVELCEDGYYYSLVECGREKRALYEGRDFPALSFDGVALATDRVEEHKLPLRNVSDREMRALLENEMSLTWGLEPAEYQLSWFRPDEAGHDVLVGCLKNTDWERDRELAGKISDRFLALVPARRRMVADKEDVFYAARHAAMVAAGQEQDMNFLSGLQEMGREGQNSRYYLLAAKGVGTFTGLVLAVLVCLYAFTEYKIYAVTKTLKALQEAGEQYDFYMETNRKIKFLEGRIAGLGRIYRFRTEQVEGILDAMPDSDNEIIFLRTRDTSGASAQGLVLEGRMGEMRQLKRFVEQLTKLPAFNRVTIGRGKNLGQDGFGYTLDLEYGGSKHGK